MSFIWFLIIGGILGWLAGLILGKDIPGGIIGNIIAGIIGAWIGSFLLDHGDQELVISILFRLYWCDYFNFHRKLYFQSDEKIIEMRIP